jgi:hypothetical protein
MRSATTTPDLRKPATFGERIAGTAINGRGVMRDYLPV